MTDIKNLAEGLSEAQRDRLLKWPHWHSSLFQREPDEIAMQLCALGIGVIMPWQFGRQMGLTSAIGLKVRAYLKENERG